MEYADYHHAMAQHAAALSNNNQLHPAMAQIPMLSAAGLNLTVMSGQLTQGNQHIGQMQGGHHVMYQNVQQQQQQQQQQQVTQQQHHQQTTHQVQSNNHNNHHATGTGHGGGHQSHSGGGGGSSKKNKKQIKVNKDGVPAPKRATTAYINFTQWYREELKKTGRPIPKIGEFGKECAAKWNAMTEEEKKPFLEVAERDRDRYRKEMAIFKPARDANKPKRPGTAFMLFMGDFRKEMAGKEPEGGVAALAKLGGERWRGMTEDDKRPYVEKQNEEKIKYEVKMEDYRRTSAAGISVVGGPKVAVGRLSTEGGGGSEGLGSEAESDSGTIGDQSLTAPSPAATSSSPPVQSPNSASATSYGAQFNSFGQAAQGAVPPTSAYQAHYNWQ
ncbi:High mobility group protein B3 [Halotydeus destructor]|nr:High mobility group protein B3 [Halotydeus destructor]